jgi:hypothetical protein
MCLYGLRIFELRRFTALNIFIYEKVRYKNVGMKEDKQKGKQGTYS